MTATQTSSSPSRQDQKVDVKVVTSGLWVAMLFVFAYVDIFTALRADVITGVLGARSPGPDSTSTSPSWSSQRSTSWSQP